MTATSTTEKNCKGTVMTLEITATDAAAGAEVKGVIYGSDRQPLCNLDRPSEIRRYLL